MSQHILAITTIATEDAAVQLARELLERRVVACVNIIDTVRSVFRWRGAIEDEMELVLLMKTRADRFDALELALSELHPYETPELVAIPITAGAADYLSWLDKCVSLN